MKNRKKMIIWGGTAIVLIAAASVGISLIHNSRNASEELDKVYEGDELGIHYGGSFDETTGTFRDGYEPDDSERGSGAESDDTSEDDIEMAPEERIKKFKEADKGEIYEEENSKDSIVPYDNDSVEDLELTESVDIDENEAVERIEDFGLETDGYEEHEVICDAASQEEAESIASQIAGTVVSLNEGVATIRIEGSVDELLERLEQEGSNLMLYRKYHFKER